MSCLVRYEGPADAVWVDGVRYKRGAEVEVGDDLAEQLLDVAGHEFEFVHSDPDPEDPSEGTYVEDE